MTRRALWSAAFGLALAAPGALAQVDRSPIACGAEYVIQRGDTLQRVARRAYGPDASYRVLWDFNRDRMATRDPSLIEVGDVVQVPCLGEDGAPLPMPGAETAASEAPVEPDGAAESDGPAESVVTEALAAAAPAESVATDAPMDDAAAAAPDNAPEPEAAPAADAATQAVSEMQNPASPAIDASSAASEVAAGAVSVDPPAPDPVAPSASAPAFADEPADGPATAADVGAPAPDARGAAGAVAANPPAAVPPAAVEVAAATPPPASQSAPAPEPQPARVGVIGGGAAALTLARAALAESLGDAAPALFADAAPEGDAAPAVLLALTAPDCAAANLCETALWSDPIMDAAVAVHAPAGLATPLALAGLRVCLGGAEAAGLRAMAGPGAYVGSDAAACLGDVAAQRAGAAVTLASSADAALQDAALREGVAEVFALAAAAPLRASAPRDDPAAAAIIAALNDGLAALRDRGDWFAVLHAHLSGAAAP